jgi:hypothetical protein
LILREEEDLTLPAAPLAAGVHVQDAQRTHGWRRSWDAGALATRLMRLMPPVTLRLRG